MKTNPENKSVNKADVTHAAFEEDNYNTLNQPEATELKLSKDQKKGPDTISSGKDEIKNK